jgi:uncharacterized protein
MRLSCLTLVLLFGLALLPVQAQELGRFEGQAAVADQSLTARNAALPQALAQLLVKLSGDPTVAEDPQLQQELLRAPELMQQFRYRQLDPAEAGGARLALVASFERGAVEAMLAAAGKQIWPEPRPVVVVWLAIDDGRGPRLVSHAQAQAVIPLGGRAGERGLRLNYPLLDLEDQRLIDVSRVWNADLAAVDAATVRYQSRVALLGRLYRAGDGWAADWRLIEAGATIERQQVRHPQAATALAAGADLAADALARRHFGRLFDAGPAGRYTIWVEGILSGHDYARLIGYLQQLPLVRSVTPVRAVDDRLLLDLDLGSGVEGLARQVAGDIVLQPLPPQPGERQRRFRLEP